MMRRSIALREDFHDSRFDWLSMVLEWRRQWEQEFAKVSNQYHLETTSKRSGWWEKFDRSYWSNGMNWTDHRSRLINLHSMKNSIRIEWSMMMMDVICLCYGSKQRIDQTENRNERGSYSNGCWNQWSFAVWWMVLLVLKMRGTRSSMSMTIG